ncbi:MAG TPA: FAD-dependent oxidoreductase [Thermoplasmatales archaeon]|nr:FAD-dependent oxidoreductase [Thermoplasmatales archaeon]
MEKVCIIGGGVAGLTAAALLSKKGYSVDVFEREELLGGRALTLDPSELSLEEYHKLLSRFHMHIPFSEPSIEEVFSENLLDGYYIDLGYHAIGGGEYSNINQVLESFNEKVEFLESFVGFIKEDGYDYPFLSKIDKIRILPNILRLLLASEKTLQKLDSVPISETIKKYGRGKMKLILEVFSRSITTVNNLDKISTGEMIRAQRNLYRGSKPVGYPKGGLRAVHGKLASIIHRLNGKIHLSKPITRIEINDNKVQGVVVGEEFKPYDIVISTLPPQYLFNLVDEELFPKEYTRALKTLTGTGSLCAYYALREIKPGLIGKTFHFIERDIGVDGDDAVGMIDFMTASPESRLSPKDRFLVQSYIICTPEEAKDKSTLEKLREILDKNLSILVPNYEKHLEWSIYPAIWHLDGVAKTIDNPKPSIITPIENLYIIGDGVKALGIGFNCAVNSARLLDEYLSKT